MTADKLPSTCWECNTTCGALLDVRGGRVVGVGPNRDHPASRGAFCAKGIRALPEWTYGEGRILRPLARRGARGAGEWDPIGWDEALDRVAEGVIAVRGRHGPLAVAGAVSGAFFSRGAIVALLMRSIGSPNWLINQDLCGGCRAVSDRVTGLAIANGEDIEHAACALVVGRNPPAADPVQWRALQAARKRGARLVVIDPKRTPAAERADVWLRVRPGTDAAVALAMIHVLVAEDRHDREFVARWCSGFERLAERAGAWTPAEAARVAGVRAEDIVAAARHYADGPSTFVSGHGIDAFSAGFQTFRAFHCLVAISGNLDRAGGNRRVKKPAGFRQYLDLLHDPAFRLPDEVARRAIGADRFPLWAGPDGWQTACHNPSVIEAILTGEPYPVRALYVSGVNVVVTYPGTQRTVEALRSLDFLAVATQHMTPTAAWADVVLPKTTTLEEEEVSLQPAGPCVSYTRPAHPPLGEARCDLDIANGLLDRLEARGALWRRLIPWRDQRAFNEYLLGDSGITIEALRASGYATFPFALGDFEARGFATPTGRVELWSTTLERLGLDPLPGYTPPSVDTVSPATREAFPLTLNTGEREKNYHHSRFREQAWLRARSPDPIVQVAPETADSLGVGTGDWVAIETPGGASSCRVKVEVSDRIAPGALSTGMGWWRPEAPGPWHGALAVNVNAALGYGAPWDPVTGSADSRGIPCRVRGCGPG